MKQELQQSLIGDVERDEAIGQLSDHFVAGRLDPAEFEERTVVALRAKTESELDGFVYDLPGPNRPTRTADRASPRFVKIFASAVCVGAAIVVGLLGVLAHTEEASMPVSVCDATVQENCVWPDELEPVEDQPR